ncbi:sortase [Candidatus Saccharibacteria bacterium]|nr:sortase [Candidatus Saccharibacteria bacterium]
MSIKKLFYFFLLPLFFALLSDFSPLIGSSREFFDASPLLSDTPFDSLTPVSVEPLSLAETFSTANVVNMNTTPVATPSNGIKFYIINPEIIPDNATVLPAPDDGIKHYKSLLYGHSLSDFDPIKYLSVGDLVSLTKNGITTLYRVSARNVYNKARDLDGVANSVFRDKLYTASGHALNLMTCGDGTNDDSAYRLVLSLDRA